MAASLEQPMHFSVHRRPLPSSAQPIDYMAHNRTRTISSAVLPPTQSYSQHPHPPPMHQNRRTLSTSTSSTTNSSLAGRPQQAPPSTYASSIRRSTSSRSNNTPSSYVALMRKQKATVWCDRAQHEDARILAQQRAAKARAQMEVVGGVSATGVSARSNASSGGIASKIRHHGAVKASAYSAAGNLSGAGVPMRLSASEVDEENSDDDSAIARYHTRNGSGRSSLNSGHRIQSYYGGPTPKNQQFSNGSTPPSNKSYSPVERPIERERQDSTATTVNYMDETPVAGAADMTRNDYFSQTGGNGGSSGSEEARFGDVGGLPRSSISNAYNNDRPRVTGDELRRRGSVDDRTTTMSGVRLFVANPDTDSD